MADLYDTDILAWSERQAALLRRRADGELLNEAEIDWPNVAEEIDQLGKNQADELASRIGTIIEHLLKLEASPAIESRVGWKETILRSRSRLEDLLEGSPSLCQKVDIDAVIAREMARQRSLVGKLLTLYGEAPRVPMAGIAYDRGHVLGDWFPETAGDA